MNPFPQFFQLTFVGASIYLRDTWDSFFYVVVGRRQQNSRRLRILLRENDGRSRKMFVEKKHHGFQFSDFGIIRLAVAVTSSFPSKVRM